MLQFILLALLTLAVGALDVRRFRRGQPTFSTLIRGEEGIEPSIAALIGILMVVGVGLMAIGCYGQSFANGGLALGIAIGLFVHLFLNKH